MIGASVYKRSLPQNNRENAIRRSATTFAKARPKITPTASFTDIANSAGKYMASKGENPGKYGAMDLSGQQKISEGILDATTPDMAGIGFTNTYKDGKFTVDGIDYCYKCGVDLDHDGHDVGSGCDPEWRCREWEQPQICPKCGEYHEGCLN